MTNPAIPPEIEESILVELRRRESSTAWRDVDSPHVGDYLERIKVPGGWLYRCKIIDEEHDMLALAMTFVPEPEEKSK